MGGLTGVEKINILDGGKYEMVVNSCFEDLKGGVGFCFKGRKKKRNERVKTYTICLKSLKKNC